MPSGGTSAIEGVREPTLLIMRILEQHVVGKHPDQRLCEDMIVVHGPFVAVIDGATDKSGNRIATTEGSTTPGRFAASVLATAIESLRAGVSPAAAVHHFTAVWGAAIDEACGPSEPHERPSASIVMLDTSAGLVWRVGDCPFRIDAGTWNTPKCIDRVTSNFRAAFLAATAGGYRDDPSCADPGREAILPLLRAQANLANVSGEFGYGVLNGTPVPPEFIEVVQLPEATREIVLASDGYPALPATLAEAEAELARLLALDPSCVGPLRATKGLLPGMLSFDDRSWIRIALDPRSTGAAGSEAHATRRELTTLRIMYPE